MTRRTRLYGRLKIALDREVINGTPIWELYIAWRGRGFYVGWGSEQ